MIFREFYFLDQLNHPNIMKMQNCSIDGVMTDYNGLNPEPVSYIVMECLPNGTLYKQVNRLKYLSENTAQFLFLQIASAVHYMHGNNVAHLDLKLENILLDEYFNAKISDFGCSKGVLKSSPFIADVKGTMNYMAPEISRLFELSQKLKEMLDPMAYLRSIPREQLGYNAFKADIYSLGVILLRMVTSKFPAYFIKESEGKFSSIGESVYHNTNLSEHLCDLLDKLLLDDPIERIGFEEIFNHPWLIDQSQMNVSDSFNELSQKEELSEIVFKIN